MVVSGELVARAKDRELKVKGPIRLPTKKLTITTRKSVSTETIPLICLDTDACFFASLAVRVPRPGTTSSFASTSA